MGSITERFRNQIQRLRGPRTTTPEQERPSGDDGERTIQLLSDYTRRVICLRMDEPVRLLTFTPEQARQLAHELRVHANRHDAHRLPRQRR